MGRRLAGVVAVMLVLGAGYATALGSSMGIDVKPIRTARPTSSPPTTTAHPTTPTTTAPPASGVVEHVVTPERVTINVHGDAVGWSAASIANLLRANAYQLKLLGPKLTIDVEADAISSCTVSAALFNGVYSRFKATIYLQAIPGTTFSHAPDFILAHEYGHAWAYFHLYLSESGKWDAYLRVRGLLGDSRLDSGYAWMTAEIMAEDYRLLFGSAAAVAESQQVNDQIPDARTVPGLRDFLAASW